jgi:hypothetical protein
VNDVVGAFFHVKTFVVIRYVVLVKTVKVAKVSHPETIINIVLLYIRSMLFSALLF